MMKTAYKQTNLDSRRGVALIVVLGFLTLLMMLAAAFLAQARMERKVAGYTLNAQRGRQLVRTAINAAMNDYSVEMWNERLMAPPPDSGYDIFTSVATGPMKMSSKGTLKDDNILLLVSEVQRWIPRRYLTTQGSNIVAQSEWRLVREDPDKSTSKILGRYAYAVFDMSGGIDANLIAASENVANVGNHTNRFSVRDVGMGELSETADANEFKRLRRGWHGFDNLAEMILLTNGKYNGGEQEYIDDDQNDDIGRAIPAPGSARWREPRRERTVALTSTLVSDLVPYSLSGYRGIYHIGRNVWERDDIRSCEDMANWSDSDILKVLADVEGQLFDINGTLETVKDYITPAGAIARGTADYPSSKAMPMFNKFALSIQPDINPAAMTVTLDIELEFGTWFPFPSYDNDNPGSFSIVAPTIGDTGAEDIQLSLRMQDSTRQELTVASWQPATLSPEQLSAPTAFNGGNPQNAGKIMYQLVGNLSATTSTPTAPFRIRTGFTVAGIEMKNSGGTTVDKMACQPPQKDITIGQKAHFYMEVTDPRLNHDTQQWGPVDSITWNDVNEAAKIMGYGARGGEGRYMYCRNGPMKSPAEFGFISTGRPWETIDLCTIEGAALMSKMVASNNILNELKKSENHNYNNCYTYYTNGTINPNTSSTNVLKAAFTALYKEEVPNTNRSRKTNDDDWGELSAEMATALAKSMMDTTSTKKLEDPARNPKAAFMYGSDWARSPVMQKNGELSRRGLNKNQRETLLRNTWGLFSPNNSMFTVVVIGQAIAEGPSRPGIWSDDDEVVGERRAAALVWRDPIPSNDGQHHEMFIRMFKFLNE